MKTSAPLLAFALTLSIPASALEADDVAPPSLWAHDNLVAWCAVPFDAKKRGPEERADMLQRLGFQHFAYDWRDKDIPTFDAEIDALQKHNIELLAWWFPLGLPPAKVTAFLETFKRHNVHPQLWVTDGGTPTPTPDEQKLRVGQEVARLATLEKEAVPYGCRVELYNHNWWFGLESNELALLAGLKQMGITDVGLVYNFSHAHDAQHDDTTNFPELWQSIQPYVVAVNITGMGDPTKILYPSQGRHELDMMRIIQQSGWHGRIGLIAEKGGDAEVTLGNYITGLDWLAAELKQPGSGGPPPFGPPAP